MTLDDVLRRRLVEVGLDPDALDDARAAWHRLHEHFGARITLIDRYALEAAQRRIGPDELDGELRARLQAETLRAQSPGVEFIPGAERSSDDALQVVAYDPDWPRQFAEWRSRLLTALGGAAIRIEHVGSTAVPGLAAKPTVDIQVSVADVADEAAYVAATEGVGLRLRFREPGHRFFRPPADRPRSVHVHFADAGSAWEYNRLAFRDLLRADPVLRDAYAALKRDLAERYRNDRLAYTDAKTDFILDALASLSEGPGR